MESQRSYEVSCSSSPPPSWCSAEEPADTFEMEAAKTLADLAQFAVRERGSESPGKMIKQVKSESPPSRPELTPYDSVSSRPRHVVEASNFDSRTSNKGQRVDIEIFESIQNGQASHPLTWGSRSSMMRAGPENYYWVWQDREISTQQQGRTCENVALKAVKPEKDAGSYNLSRICLSGYSSFGGGQTRQNLTEAEKEEKRLRRVLANRESARRTIRRRQALCDALTQKAAELAQENEELRKGREAALKEYQLLETTNKKLKEKITKAIEPEITQSSDEQQAVRPEFSASSTSCPMFNGSFRPVFWPAAFHLPILGQSQEGPAIPPPNPSNIMMPALFKPDPSLVDTPSPRAPVYVIPYPLLFPIPDPHGNHCQSACHLKNKQSEEHTSSWKTVQPSDGGDVVLPNVAKTASRAEIRLIDDLNQMPIEHESYGCEEHIDAPSLDASQFGSSEHSAIVKQENGLDIDVVRTNEEPVSSPASHTAFIKREDTFQPGISCSKTRIGAVAAAEARRRRKELTKLSFQVCNFQMQC